MDWQDIVISIGQLIFVLALIPSIVGNDKPAVSTSLINGLILAIFTFTFASLGLWFSTISSAMISLAWIFLAKQKHTLNKSSK